jgi:hypothetical protein
VDLCLNHNRPSYVDDVLEFNLAAFPLTGELSKIYIAINSKKLAISVGVVSAYIAITNGLIASTADVPENASFLYFHRSKSSRYLTGITFNQYSRMAADSLIVALENGKAQLNK